MVGFYEDDEDIFWYEYSWKNLTSLNFKAFDDTVEWLEMDFAYFFKLEIN